MGELVRLRFNRAYSHICSSRYLVCATLARVSDVISISGNERGWIQVEFVPDFLQHIDSTTVLWYLMISGPHPDIA